MAHHGTGKRFFASQWFLLGGVVVLVSMSMAYGRAVYQNYQIQSEIDQLKKEKTILEAKKIQTLNTLDYVKSPAYAAAEGRTELNLMGSGEHVVIINTPTVATSRQTPAKVLESISSVPAEWFHYFFH